MEKLLDPSAPFAVRDAKELAVEVEKLPSGEIGVKIRIFGQKTDRSLDRHVRDVPAQDPGPAGGRVDQPHEEVHGGRLPGPIGAKIAEDLPLPDLQVEVVKHPDPGAPESGPELFRQAFGLYNKH